MRFIAEKQALRNRRHRHDDVVVVRQLPLVIFQGRDHDLGFAGIGAMHGLAVVPQSLLGESFRVAPANVLKPDFLDNGIEPFFGVLTKR